MAAAGVLLDTPYFGAGPSLLDAIACATPFVTLGGETQRARMGAGLLEFMALGEYVAPSSRDYVSIAVALASDKTSHDAMSALLRAAAPRIFADPGVIERWAEYFSVRVTEAAHSPGPLPAAYGD